jgi:ribonuclease HII
LEGGRLAKPSDGDQTNRRDKQALSDSTMAYLIGTDEAGYGPNLGPLVIGATVWQVPGNWLPDNLYEHLADVIATQSRNDDRLVLADSKALYQRAKGIGLLETQVLAALQLAGIEVNNWQEVWRTLTSTSADLLASIPWYRDFDASLPMCGSSEQAAAVASAASTGLNAENASIQRLRAVAIFPGQFNDLVDQFGNKASVLSHVTIELARELMDSCNGQSVLIHCDKHGGRNRYLAILQHFFPDSLIQVVEEGRQQSIYRWTDSGREVRIRFVAKGERFPPSALASMIAKYLRELAMHAFNEYWKQQVPGVRPTAGYPVDAKRFKQDIAQRQQELEIKDHDLWRNR